ncbi:hypothetical protein [Pseudomonas huanghezhanensis]|uniref:hypothetical protein n=1 Tax=Pseudomonas huanghezhanensis TaxID=3002903 RepID=UPI0022865D86|nr:hypothetical protein [Pseudomonas sp. BSw22131]
MPRTDAPKMLFVGWDVGGWNCDYNPKSRDALAILDAERQTVGHPWRGNLRQLINQSSSTEQFVQRLLALCGAEAVFQQPVQMLMGIDTPLGCSRPFIDLITHGCTAAMIGDSQKNPYLHRRTEHFLFERGLAPLSPIKDMIGSQATKGMHVTGRFAPTKERCGVWTDNQFLRAFEAYPSACKRSSWIKQLRAPFHQYDAAGVALPGEFVAGLEHVDVQDALTCALIAWTFEFQPDLIAQPGPEIDPVEGWIFVPTDCLLMPKDE